jgi:hypothetical protein
MSNEEKSAMPVITIDITETGQMKQKIRSWKGSIPASALHASMFLRESSRITRKTKWRGA